jgi:hypothetical protein
MRHSQGFIIAYEITSRRSFEEVDNIYLRIMRMIGEKKKVPILLIGIKPPAGTNNK